MSIVTSRELADYEANGYFVIRGLLGDDDVRALKDEVARVLQESIDHVETSTADAARADGSEIDGVAKFRKINQMHRHSAVAWERFVCSPGVQELNRHLLGANVRCRGVFVFTKPARVGEPTPWHQDIALWAQRPELGELLEHFKPVASIWLALDPATRENGCLQVVPRSHQGDVVRHVKYPDSVHMELPRELTQDLEVEHVELASGDAVTWHSHLWHFSPTNNSDKNRWAMGMTAIDEENCRAIGALDTAYPMIVNGQPAPYVASSGAGS